MPLLPLPGNLARRLQVGRFRPHPDARAPRETRLPHEGQHGRAAQDPDGRLQGVRPAAHQRPHPPRLGGRQVQLQRGRSPARRVLQGHRQTPHRHRVRRRPEGAEEGEERFGGAAGDRGGLHSRVCDWRLREGHDCHSKGEISCFSLMIH